MANSSDNIGLRTGLLPFDPIILIRDVAKRWLLILTIALAVGVGAYISADMEYTPLYKTTTTYVVTTRSSSSTVYSNLSSTTSLATVFTDLLNSSILRKAIMEELGPEPFQGSIYAAVVEETNLLTVTVTASNPRTAFTVAQAIIDHHETVTYQVVDGIALEVLQYPTVPTAPVNPADASGEMVKAMLLSAAAVTVILLCISYMRDTIRSSREAIAKLDCDFLGGIHHEEKYKTIPARIRRQKTSILITNPTTSMYYVETIRKLRRRVEQHMHGGKVLMVTSLLENEGKSTVAVNLALAMAQKHNRVLLIDCDLRKPACHALMGQKKVTVTLCDILEERQSPMDALIRDKKSNLYMILEKWGTQNSGDLVSSENMQALIEWARKEFDFVVLDLPPMAGVTDAECVAEYADASLLVVRQNFAAAAAINKAIASLENGKATLLGCVLNNVYSTELHSGGYGYGYGYGKYGHYGSYGTKNAGK